MKVTNFPMLTVKNLNSKLLTLNPQPFKFINIDVFKFFTFSKENAEHPLKIVISQPQNRHRRRRLTDVDDIDLPTSTMSILSLCSRVIGFDVEESHKAMTFPEKYIHEKRVFRKA